MMVQCHVWDKLAKNRYYNNHLISQKHMNKFHKRQRLNNTNNSTAQS